MLNSSPLRAALIVIVALAGILFTLPNFVAPATLNSLPDWMPKKQIVLGLDLQGGSHLLLEVNREEIVSERVKELRREARSILANDNGIGHLIKTDEAKLTIELTDKENLETALNALQELDVPLSQSLGGVGGIDEMIINQTPDQLITIELTEEGISERLSSVVAQSIEVVRRRVDELGTTEPTIQRQGNDRILVQVPGFDDSERLKDVISKTARLTFHMVHPTMSAAQAKIQGLPDGTMILPSQDGGEELVFEEVAIGGESLVDSQPGFDAQNSSPIVTFRFDTRGGVKFAEITANNIGKRFAVVLDNQVITAPVINSAIPGGSGQIFGNFTAESANDLAVLLRAGALPATLDIIEERSVGPSLGADSVAAGETAGVVGGILVIIFMVVAYGTFGVFANISLLLNITLILGTLSLLGATLTLPGIAGIVLTIGMAVDANVLIYERIREEKRAGRGAIQAIEAGFQRAFTTILDANVTTLIAAAILFFLGSGPIRGFAVTLAIGIITTLFTAYVLTQFMISRWYARRRPKELKIALLKVWPENFNFEFMNLRKLAYTFSAVLVVGSLALFGAKGLNLGIDFKGGSAIEVQSIEGPADIAELREIVGALDLGDVQVQEFGSDIDVLIRVETQPGGDVAQQEAVTKVIEAVEAVGYDRRRSEVVGPTVSGELAQTGTLAVVAAIVAVLAYIWMRFEWQFAIGAVAALVHDVLLTIGLFALTGLEFNLASIAAILTIVGYSLNDTVVIYDRVRENLRKYRKMSIPELLNMSVNQTLSRTILTSITTLLALGALVVFGGEVIRSFTIAMAWGVLVGTYSTIFVASPLLINFNLTSRKEAAPKEERRADGASV
ncbi:protein translocase subunit SecD [Maritalea myrionectae]|uniref:Multifunctional fusion protein n=1 Tax=Maritalea myrionectae TaxID=454601 RepID=A0A2R4MF80_9HYPH|nr:protein translocase subunit SecD [Maritalea myrionectae]AVX04701.1 protein translocase subunit SecDF [Maritalea myrionectae]